LLAVVRRHTGTLGINAPPAFEAPEALVADAQARDPEAAAPHIAGLEVEEAFEDRRRPGPVGLAFSAVHQDDARRPGTDLVSPALRTPAPVAARLRSSASLRPAIGSRLDLTLRRASRRWRG
jgi:hypothetical protein